MVASQIVRIKRAIEAKHATIATNEDQSEVEVLLNPNLVNEFWLEDFRNHK